MSELDKSERNKKRKRHVESDNEEIKEIWKQHVENIGSSAEDNDENIIPNI